MIQAIKSRTVEPVVRTMNRGLYRKGYETNYPVMTVVNERTGPDGDVLVPYQENLKNRIDFYA